MIAFLLPRLIIRRSDRFRKNVTIIRKGSFSSMTRKLERRGIGMNIAIFFIKRTSMSTIFREIRIVAKGHPLLSWMLSWTTAIAIAITITIAITMHGVEVEGQYGSLV